ncbi:MAG: hypothetical protein AAFP92_31485, partial [Bacteroidota bacterium]
MRNQKLNRLLIPAVILIWIGVGWRFLDKSPDHSPSSSPATQQAGFTGFSPDTFSLLLSYPDPFSAKRVPPQTRKPVARGPKVITKVEPPAPKPPLDMHYIGYVQGTDTTQATALVRWKGQVKTISVGLQEGPWEIRNIRP